MMAPLLVSVTLPRPCSWNSMEEAQAFFRSAKSHARCYPEILEAFILGAVVKNDPANNCFDTESAYTLACHPHIEAAHYTGPSIELSMDEMGRIGCQVVFEYGARSQMFALEAKERLVQAYPDLYRLAPPIPKASHMMIMEDPDTATARWSNSLPFTLRLNVLLRRCSWCRGSE
ncbi:hypothetical protein Poli38472_003888 [Pythium oligandrum]|uniref:Uncharacterized protein n=1 Tax=Pythium oligandrum TaxID=41045 RepID=A0A8K1CNG7_PYTOL|nr:hypothetical protein Poli38472_003888 [Pythium oligandrum]|eukprot:TMW66123.1 hypothetical protein Poli38472_003888 [Pythium oligandrum]